MAKEPADQGGAAGGVIDGALLDLLHLCDSLFPTGGFAHSDGLEAAAASGQISSADDLREWIDVVLDETLTFIDGPAAARVWTAVSECRWEDIRRIDAELHALRPSSTGRAASRAMGTRLLKTWQETHPGVAVCRAIAAGSRRADGASQGNGTISVTLPVAFALVCASAGVPRRATLSGFAYTRLAAVVACAMRVIAIGQREAHALLAATLARVPAAVDAIEAAAASAGGLGTFVPAFDVAAMQQRYLRSRLFLS